MSTKKIIINTLSHLAFSPYKRFQIFFLKNLSRLTKSLSFLTKRLTYRCTLRINQSRELSHSLGIKYRLKIFFLILMQRILMFTRLFLYQKRSGLHYHVIINLQDFVIDVIITLRKKNFSQHLTDFTF